MAVITIKTIRERIKKWNVPKFFRNKFVFSFFIFITWMLFFDQNNFFVQFNRFATLRNAKQQKAYYDTETKRMQQQITALTSDNQAIERYAREKYYMKKPNEDIFVFLQDKE